MALGLEVRGELADGGGLPRPVYADQHDHRGRFIHVCQRPVVGLQHFEQILADQAAEFRRIANELAVYALPDAVEDLVGGRDADIGADERIFQFIEEVRIDLLAARDDVFKARDKSFARFLDAAFQFFE